MQWDITPSTSLLHTLHHEELHVCADGAFLHQHGQGSHGWVKGEILWEGAGPATGRSSLMTSYRAELSGLTSVLYTLHWLAFHNLLLHGTVHLYCDNKSALNMVFAKCRPSKNPYACFAADQDLIH